MLAAVAAVIVIVSAVFLINGSRDDPNRTGDDHWSLDDGVLTITGNGRTADYGPENPAPWGTEITAVKVGEGVTGIGAYAFTGCYMATSFELPSTLQTIGSHAFAGCIGFTKISFPSSLTSVEKDAFQGIGIYNHMMERMTALEPIAGHEFILLEHQLCQMVYDGLIGHRELRGYACVAYATDDHFMRGSGVFSWSL